MSCKKKALVALIGSVFMAGTAQVLADPSASMLANTCAGCHGTGGKSVGPASPNLAGMSQYYFIESMNGFKSGARPATVMDRIAKGYTESQIEAMAGYFASKPVHKAKVPHDAAKAKAGAKVYDQACSKCHDDKGALPDDDAGILAGQWLPWLQYSMIDFQSGAREMPRKMASELKKLSDEEIQAALHFFASQQ